MKYFETASNTCNTTAIVQTYTRWCG